LGALEKLNFDGFFVFREQIKRPVKVVQFQLRKSGPVYLVNPLVHAVLRKSITTMTLTKV